ncbi:MAG: amidohydrolase [Bacillota bacterium]
MSSKLLIKDAAIVTMDENQDVYESGDLLIEDDLIKIVSEKPIEADNQTEVISGEGKVVIPGLINLHNHAAMSLFRSYADDYPLMEWLQKKIFPAEARLTEEDVYWGASLAVMEMLRGGTTTFVDMYYFMEQTARVCQESGIRALLSQVFIGLDGEEGLKGLREAINFVENWQDQADGRIKTILGPHAPYTCPPDFLKQVLTETEHLNTLIHIHLSESRHEVEASLKMHGKTPVALMDDLGMFERPVLAAHCVHLTEEDIAILSSQKVGISHNPGSNLKLGNGIAPLKKLLDQDALVGLGTDGAASNNNLDMFEEVMLASLLQKGINEEPTFITANEAFSLATRRAAKALQMDELGILKEGSKADVVLLDFKRPHLQPHNNPVSNIVYSASANDVETVIVDGKILYDKGEFITLDQERIYYEANRCAKRLRQ